MVSRRDVPTVCAQEQHANVYELIDSQQRMTTCYQVLCAIRDRLLDLDPQKPMDALRGQISSTTTDAVTGEDALVEEGGELGGLTWSVAGTAAPATVEGRVPHVDLFGPKPR